MTVPRSSLLIPALLFVFAALPLAGQQVISAQSGLVHYTEGQVLVGANPVDLKFGQFPQLKENEELRTERGRAEVLLNPGVFLRVAENSGFRMLSTRLTDSRLEFLSGAMVIEAGQLAKDQAVTVLHKDVTVSLAKSGLYRFDSEPPALRVFEGAAVVETAGSKVEVTKGKMLPFDGSVAAVKFDREQTDALDNWSGRRAEYLALANVYAARSVADSGMLWRRSGWVFNPYFGMLTYIPWNSVYYSPYGYRFWSPERVYMVYAPPRQSGFGGGGGVRHNSNLGYNTVSPTSAGTSGVMAGARTAAPAPSAPPAASSPAAPISRDSGRAGGRQR